MGYVYKSLRVGQYGERFHLLKFRTFREGMHGGSPSAGSDDPRLTWWGKWLRRFKLDELPTLVNLLKGDIALVGPRPDVPSEIESLPEDTAMTVLMVKPGLVSPATLWNISEDKLLEGKEDPHDWYCKNIKPTKYRLNVWYVKKKCFCLDVRILLVSVLKLLRIPVSPKKWGVLPNWL